MHSSSKHTKPTIICYMTNKAFTSIVATTTKREKAMAYALAHQWQAGSRQLAASSGIEPDKSSWGWSLVGKMDGCTSLGKSLS